MNTEGVDNNSNIFNEAKNIIDGTDKKMEISQFNGPIRSKISFRYCNYKQ